MTDLRAFNVCVMANVTVPQVQGVVQDSSARSISDARIELSASADHAPVASVISDITGRFVIAGVKSGWYWLKASAPGFSQTDAHIHVSPRRFLLFPRRGSLVLRLVSGAKTVSWLASPPPLWKERERGPRKPDTKKLAQRGVRSAFTPPERITRNATL